MKSHLEHLSDRLDDQRARRLRQSYGQYRWLVSWYQEEDGRWLARLSCPGWPETIEARGSNRVSAIVSADRELRGLLKTLKTHSTSRE